MEYYYISKGVKYELHKELKEIYLNDKYVSEIVIPSGCKKINIDNNKLLTNLIIPEECNYVECYSCGLTNLVIPKTCKYVDCRYNNIVEITNYSKNCKIKHGTNTYVNHKYKEIQKEQKIKSFNLKLYITDILSVVKLFLKKLKINS
jgi:hypothetical protein